MQKYCKRCKKFKYDIKYCSTCGTELIGKEKIEPKCECGYEYYKYDRFCEKCGKKLKMIGLPIWVSVILVYVGVIMIVYGVANLFKIVI